MPKCPWDENEFVLPADQPCPVCGVLGKDFSEVQEKCVGFRGGLSDDDLGVEGFGP